MVEFRPPKRTFPAKRAETGGQARVRRTFPAELAKTLGFALLTAGLKRRKIGLAARREPVTAFQ